MNLQATSFNLENARELAMWASRAYSDTPTISDASTDTQVLIEDCGEYIIIAFRGTSSLRDFITDADCLRMQVTCGKVHAGFWNAWLGIKEAFKGQLTFGDKPIFVTGHSLGGALAMIAAKYLSVARFNVQGIYTFGCPRVGDKTFQKNYNAWQLSFDAGCGIVTLGDRTFTLINDTDVVPCIPFWPRFRRPGHDEFISQLRPNRVEEDPSIWFRLFSAGSSLLNAWEARRDPLFADELLLDHHISNYIAALGMEQAMEAIAA